MDPGEAEELQRKLRDVETLLSGLVALLHEKGLVTTGELRAAAEAAEQEA